MLITFDFPADDAETSSKTLAESAAAHQAKMARPELQEVEVKTGEENESNVFQVDSFKKLLLISKMLKTNHICALI